MDEFKATHRVSARGDLFMNRDARPFIDQEVMLVKICRSGLYQVALPDGRLLSLAKFRLDPLDSASPQDPNP